MAFRSAYIDRPQVGGRAADALRFCSVEVVLVGEDLKAKRQRAILQIRLGKSKRQVARKIAK